MQSNEPTDNLPTCVTSAPYIANHDRSNRKLTFKQSRFVDEYFIDGNATKAARRAGYSERHASAIGYQLLQLSIVQQSLATMRQELAAKCQVTPEMVIQGFKHGAFYDIKDIYNPDGSLKDIHEIPEAARCAIAGIDIEELYAGKGEDRVSIGQVKKVRLVSRFQNLDSLAKHLGLYDADNRQQAKEMVFRVVYETKQLEGD